MTEYALRGAPIRGAQPGRLYASHPTFPTYCEALRKARYFPDVPLLFRRDGGEWRPLSHNPKGPVMPNQPRADNPARAIRVPDDLWRAAQEKAAERGETVSDVVRKALERYVKRGAKS